MSRKKKAGLLFAGAAVAAVAALASRSSHASSGGVFAPTPQPSPQPQPSSPSSPSSAPAQTVAQVAARVVAAVMSRDPKVMRAEAARLRAEGWPSQAGDLEEAARRVESLQPQPTTPAPTKPPAPPAPPVSVTPSPLPGIIPPSNPQPAPKPPAATPAAPSSVLRNLRSGDTGTDVTAWQGALVAVGFGNLTPNGSFGSATDAATKNLQTDTGITVDGIVGPQTRAALIKPPILGRRTLKEGSRGPAVKSWQIALIADGFPSPTDGHFNAQTKDWTKLYQAARALDADGIVGSKTVAAIGPRKVATPAPVATLVVDPDKWRSPLKSGMSGADVAEWQLVLTRDLRVVVTTDGIFGPVTVARTIEWQKAKGLGADGVVGPATRAKIATGQPAFVAGDVDLAPEWRPFRETTPLPGLIEPAAPTESVPFERALAARVAHNLHFSEAETEDRELIAQFQASNGLNPTGAYGPGTAEKLIEYGFVPPAPRVWPSKESMRVRAQYKAALLAQARRDKPRAAEWQAAVRAIERV
jgi:peptidoglycan hydrolase-like protein with peptidoglycan-binding domain